MNEELYTLFKELNSESVKTLLYVFKDAPKMQLLIAFLEEQQEHFGTPKVVRAIYGEELDSTDFNILSNRYHKLRQTLIDWLYQFLKKTSNFTTREEQEVDFLKYLVSKNQFQVALQRATDLEERLWANNIFELLPDLIHLIIFCRQSLAHSKEEIVLSEKKLDEAIDLNYQLQRLQSLYQKFYARLEVEEYKSLLNEIRKIITSYKNCPRFQLIYSYTAFSRGNFIQEIVKTSSNALIRHLNQMEEIRKQFPEMPFVFLSLPRAKSMHAKLLVLKSIFCFHKGKFQEAAQELRELDLLKKNNPNIEFPESEGVLRNSISIYIGNQQFEIAMELCEDLEQFYQKNGHLEKMDWVLYEQSLVYFFQFPKGDLNAMKEHRKKLELKNPDSPLQSILLVAQAWLDLALGKALTSLQLEKIKWFHEMNGNVINIQLIDNLSKNIAQKNHKGIQTAIKDIQRQMKEKLDAVELLFWKQMVRIGKNYEL